MQAATIRKARHFAAEGVDLAHQLALRASADGRVARERADLFRIARYQERRDAQARRRERRFDAGVAAADDDDAGVVFTHHDASLTSV